MMVTAKRRRAESPDYWRFWWIVPVMIFCGISWPAFTPHADAATVDHSYNICRALRSGATLAAVEAQLTGMGMSEWDAGAATGQTVRDNCPDQTASVTAQAQAGIAKQAGA